MVTSVGVFSRRLFYDNGVVFDVFDALNYLRNVLSRTLKQDIGIVWNLDLETTEVLADEIALECAANLLVLPFEHKTLAHVVHVSYVLSRLSQTINTERGVDLIFLV